MEGRRQNEPISEAEFLDWAEPLDERFELVEGVVVMQAGASRGHERVAGAIFASLYAQADPAIFDVNKGGFGVRVAEHSGRGSVLYPNVLVDRPSGDDDERVTTTALVVVEVLSPSTNLAFHVRKLERYKRLDSLTSYLVFDQKVPVVRIWRRVENGWPATPTIVEGRSHDLDLPEIGAILRLADVYRTPREA